MTLNASTRTTWTYFLLSYILRTRSIVFVVLRVRISKPTLVLNRPTPNSVCINLLKTTWRTPFDYYCSSSWEERVLLATTAFTAALVFLGRLTTQPAFVRWMYGGAMIILVTFYSFHGTFDWPLSTRGCRWKHRLPYNKRAVYWQPRRVFGGIASVWWWDRERNVGKRAIYALT